MLKSDSLVLGKTYTGNSPAKTKGKGRPMDPCGEPWAAFVARYFSVDYCS